LEVRGVGIVEVPYCTSIRVLGVVNLVDSNKIQRLPEQRIEFFLGVEIPSYQLNPWNISAVEKVKLVSGLISGSIILNND
jgi:serine kinase of HPr protein (carbohydrate metabolism regulator)